MNPDGAKQKIEEVQCAYRKWLKLHPQLEQTLAALNESVSIMQTLKDFYFGGAFVEISQLLEENQVNLNLATPGEYSIMSEDVIWNAVHDQQTLLWKFLRTSVSALDEHFDPHYRSQI